MIVTKERKYLFIHKVALENTQQKTPHVENSRLFVKKVFTRVAKYLNTIASILRENMVAYLSLDIICSSRLTSFLGHRLNSFLEFFPWTFFKENVDIDEK